MAEYRKIQLNKYKIEWSIIMDAMSMHNIYIFVGELGAARVLIRNNCAPVHLTSILPAGENLERHTFYPADKVPKAWHRRPRL
jgi:hypothetical protein